MCDVCAALTDAEAWNDLRVHEDELVVLAHVPPAAGKVNGYPGHLLFVPRRHVESPAAVSDAEAERIGLWLARASRLLESTLHAEHVYLARLGDGWAHLHYHVIARYAGTPAEYRGLNVREWRGIERCTREQVAAVAAKLRVSVVSRH